MVPKAGLEPARLAPPPPQDGVSTNFTTSAFSLLLNLHFQLFLLIIHEKTLMRGVYLLFTLTQPLKSGGILLILATVINRDGN